MSGYFKREGDRGRQIQGVAKPILALLDWALFNALLKKGNLRLIQTDARILNRWIINCKNIRRTLSALRSTVFYQSVFMVMKINLKHSSCLKDDLLDTWCTASFYYSLVWRGGEGRFASLQKPSVSVSVRPHETTWLPLDGFSCNLIFEHFSKTCQKIKVSFKSDKNNG